MTIPVRLALYTLLALLIAWFFQMRLIGTPNTFAEVGNLILWISFCVAAPLLDRAVEKQRDEAYLYYLGVSGLRMLVYMGGVGLAVFSSPALRHRTMLLVLTVGFLLYTVVEVTALVRKLREIFKSNP